MENATAFALSIKGGYYNFCGEIVDSFVDAKLFTSTEEAINFRKKYDPLHRVDEAQLLQVSMFAEDLEDLEEIRD